MTVPIAIEAQGISFSYEEGFLALDNLDFLASKGEFIALLASNGSGKTTLIKTLTGLIKPQKGHVRIDGKELRSYSQTQLYQKIGLVFQNPNDQLFAATVEEDVAFGPRNLGLSEDEVQRRVKKALETMRVKHLRKRAIHHVSFGEQKRVAIAGILAMRPAILILDEPTAGLDPEGEAMMVRLLNNLNREQGMTIILATHSVDVLPLFAHRIYLLNRGKVLKAGTPAAIFSDQELIRRAGLRLPYVAGLLDELKQLDGVPIDGMPLTLGEAREKLLELIPDELIIQPLRRKV